MDSKSFFKLTVIVGLVGILDSASALAYPEFQTFIVAHSKKPINCAMCHVNSDGPDGNAPGQIGGLTPEELNRLAQARTAFESGKEVDSPILNEFGNHIIKNIGRTKFIELRRSPEHLADALDPKNDLDNDGIPDVQEFLEGSHPLIKNDGDPWSLFKTNFQRNLPQIILTIVATLAGIYGLIHLLRGFAIAFDRSEDTE